MVSFITKSNKTIVAVSNSNSYRKVNKTVNSSDTYWVCHYTSVECLKLIVDTGFVKGNVGIYGYGVYVTTSKREQGGGMRAIGMSIFDSNGGWVMKSGRVSACIKFKVTGTDLMYCNSPGKHHVGFVYRGDMEGHDILERARGTTYNQMKKNMMASADYVEYPDVVLSEAKVRKQSETRFCATYNFVTLF